MAGFHSAGTEFLVRLMDQRVLGPPDARGRRRVPDALAAALRGNAYHQRGFALAAACVASPASGRHALSDHPEIWRLAIDVGESLRRLVDRMMARPQEHPPHFAHRFLPPLYRLVEARLPAAARRRWRRTMARFIASGTDYLLPKEAAWGKPGPYTGTGPNHLFAIAGQIEAAGRILADADARRFARRAMHALCALQTPEGYFPENNGPSVGYMLVYLGGLSDYVASSGDAKVRAVLRRAAAFSTRALYPDLRLLATIDQRNRWGGGGGIGAARFAWVPAGRTVVLAAIEQAMARLAVADPVRMSRPLGDLAIELLQAPDGPAAPVPAQRAVHHDSFDGLATVGRKAGWFHALSGYHRQPQQYDQYQYERTENLSVYHDACGLIVGGGNDKFAPHAATVEILESGEVHYFPAVAASASGTAAAGRLRLDFGAATAELRARVLSAKRLELTASATTNFRENSNRLNLQIPSMGGRTLEVDGAPFPLHASTATLRIVPVRRHLTSPGQWTIEVPGGAELHWPHVPYPKMDYPGPLDTAVAFLRIALGGRGERRTVRFHVPPVAAGKGRKMR
jgi:hypothetical protein